MSRSNVPASLGRSVVFHDDRIERLERTGEGGGAGALMVGSSAPPPPVGESVTQVAEGHDTAGAVTFDGSFARAGWDSQGVSEDGVTTGHTAYYGARIVVEGASMRDVAVTVTVDGFDWWGPTQDSSLGCEFASVLAATVVPPAVEQGRELGLSVDPGGATVDVTVTWFLVEEVAGVVTVSPVVRGTKTGGDGDSSTLNLTITTPTETVAGDELVLIFAGHVNFGNGTGELGALTPPSGWEMVHDFGPVPASGTTRGTAVVMSRTATAGDASGGGSYAAQVTTAGGTSHTAQGQWLVVAFSSGITSFGSANSKVLAQTGGGELTVGGVGGGWSMVCSAYWSTQSSGAGATFTEATELAESSPGGRKPRLWMGEVDRFTEVVGTFASPNNGMTLAQIGVYG